MKLLDNHIILIGFKHVGKSVIARHLAEKLYKNFVDLDREVEMLFEKKTSKKLSCRQIMQTYGEIFFRDLEVQSLSHIIHLKPCIIALGGGTPLEKENKRLILSNFIVHITAPRGIVFERIMINGIPSFFSSDEDPIVFFNYLWEKREKVYKSVANISIENDCSIELAVEKILSQI